ncbi:penicillin acylase family protein [Nocardioides sp. TRM66260-LWL]|uniref:penicillin acylase family protein n=1 Tax=Nocardioides sp. TRM66260-LWL TaxID=2874478 RepID=UPI001CC6CD43|nr:penicillin acylase family protein [Nocardioides sp. TRM66260-LWL]MBZ5735114.1 penicillin acylase family protein [Nocardioides sp. TRM66260-LWL]
MTDASRRPSVRARLEAFRALPRPLRLGAWGSVALVLVLIAAAIGGTVVARRPLPQVDGTLTLPGLGAEVEVVRDAHGIPQLYGDSVADLAAAQGFVHAQERFFEMDVRRHATAGRLAELFGPEALPSDRLVRTLGWRRVAERELALVRPDTRAFLEAYARGVNAYLHSRGTTRLGVEYAVLAAGGLRYRPEDWSPVDSLAWLKAMAWDLRGNLDDEIDRALSIAAVGPRRAAQLFPPYDERRHAPIVTQGAVVDGVYQQDARAGGTRKPLRPAFDAAQVAALRRTGRALTAAPAWLGRGDGVGSNSWVVAGRHTVTGRPILADDPHLGVGLPGVWMQMGLHCRTVSTSCPLDVAGFTFSGVPGVLIGHNADIAWGFTNLGADVTDLYVERLRGRRWLDDGRLRPLTVRTETIRVRGQADERLTVRATRHGPLLSDLPDAGLAAGDDLAARATTAGRGGRVGAAASAEGRLGEGTGVALRWTALDPAPTADAILDLDLATDWRSFRAAAASFAVPAQNLVYADRRGHIGYQAPGRVPIRVSGDGRLPVAGWRPENEWRGYVPFDALPSVLDPREGLVVTANQAVVGRDYPYLLTRDWDRGYRSQRIRDRLSSMLADGGRVGVDDLAALQLDSRNPIAATLVPRLLRVPLSDPFYRDAQRLLEGWDLTQPADGPQSAAAAYFNAVWRALLARTFHDELPRDLWPDGGQRWYAVMESLLERPDDPFWDDVTTPTVRETRDDVLRAALLQGRDELTRLMSRDLSGWTWGRVHRLDLRSPTLGESGIAPVEALVNRGPWFVGGGTSAVDAASWDAASSSARPYAVTTAPSMRMVVSLADLDASRWISLTGVSGHPFSAHYTDQTDLWARGETLPWAFGRPAVDAAARDRLRLVPGADG